MNHIDNNKAQYEAYGNTVRFIIPIPEPQHIEQNERVLLRELLCEMTSCGKYDVAIIMLLDTIEKLEDRIKELEKK